MTVIRISTLAMAGALATAVLATPANAVNLYKITVIGNLGTGDFANSLGINDFGVAFGDLNLTLGADVGSFGHAWVCDPADGNRGDLGTLGGAASTARDINLQGLIVGDAMTGVLQDLGTLAGGGAQAEVDWSVRDRLLRCGRRIGGQFEGAFVILSAELKGGRGAEDARAKQPPSPQAKHQACRQHTKAVHHRPAEIDAAGLGEVFGRAGNLTELHVQRHGLGEHLVIEHEIVGVSAKGQRFEHLARKGPVTGVVFRQLAAEHHVLKGGQQPVADVFVERHAAAAGGVAQNA